MSNDTHYAQDQYIEILERLGFNSKHTRDCDLIKMIDMIGDGCLSTPLVDTYKNILNAYNASYNGNDFCTIADIYKLFKEDKCFVVKIITADINTLSSYRAVIEPLETFEDGIEIAKKRLKILTL